jgi:hypothetical protein
MTKGASILYHHMKRFGFLMHTRKDGGKSKREALYIPPRQEQLPQRLTGAR